MENTFKMEEAHNEHLERADIDAAYEKAKKVLADPIDPEDFRDIYGER